MQTTKPINDPRKQRKRLFNAPAHIRHKLMAAPLSSELVKSRGIKSLPLRKGDTVRVMRGDRKGFEGKISKIDLKNFRLYVEGLTREKVDGTTIFIPLHPSKVMIRNLNLDDKWRKDIVERKKQEVTKEKVVEKQPKTPKEVKIETPAKAKEETKKKPEEPVRKPVAKKIAEKKIAARKPKGSSKPVKEKKPLEKENKTKTSVKKPRAKRESAKEGGA